MTNQIPCSAGGHRKSDAIELGNSAPNNIEVEVTDSGVVQNLHAWRVEGGQPVGRGTR